MANSTINLIVHPYGQGSARVAQLPVDGGAHIRKGTLVSQLTATSMLVPGSTASSGPAVGVAMHEVDNSAGDDGDLYCDVEYGTIYLFANGLTTDACSEATPMFSVVFMGDDHTIFDNSASGTLKPAGRFMGMEPDGRVRVFVGMANLADQLADASDVGVVDAGGFTSADDVEEALQELYQNARSTLGSVEIPLTAFREVSSAGAVGADAANGGVLSSETTPVLGALATTEQMAIIFAATVVDIIGTSITLPNDFDGTANATLDLFVKTDNTGGGGIEAATYSVLTTWDNNSQVTDAATDGSPSETLHKVTATIAAADIPDAPNTLSIQLVHGTHANDPTHLLGVRLNYKRKLLTA